MALNLSFNTEEISKINANVRATNDTINGLFAKTISNCGALTGAVQSAPILNELNRIIELIQGISSKLNSNMEQLVQYLDGQLMNYEKLAEEATTALQNALSFIDQNFSV